MKSKITIDIDNDNQPIIKIDYFHSEDVRDKMISRFFQALDFGSNWCTIKFENHHPEGSTSIIRPIRVNELSENAEKMANSTSSAFEKPKQE